MRLKAEMFQPSLDGSTCQIHPVNVQWSRITLNTYQITWCEHISYLLQQASWMLRPFHVLRGPSYQCG